MTHFFDVEFAFGLDRLRPQAPAPGPHSSRTGPADPDATPKPSPAPRAPSRRPAWLQSPQPYDPTDGTALDQLASLTKRLGSPLAAAQTLYAPELLEDRRG